MQVIQNSRAHLLVTGDRIAGIVSKHHILSQYFCVRRSKEELGMAANEVGQVEYQLSMFFWWIANRFALLYGILGILKTQITYYRMIVDNDYRTMEAMNSMNLVAYLDTSVDEMVALLRVPVEMDFSVCSSLMNTQDMKIELATSSGRRTSCPACIAVGCQSRRTGTPHRQ